jgi:hypothetical protein
MTHEFLIALSATLLIDTGGGAFAAIGVVTGDPGKHARRPSHSSWRCGYCFWRSGDGRSQPHHHRCRHGRATRGQQFLFGGVPASGRFQNRGQGHTPLRSRPKFLALRRRAKEARAAGKRGRRPRPPAWWRRSASRGPSHLNPHPRSSSVITPIFELPLRLAEAADVSTSGAVDHSTCAARALACGASANSADPPVRGRLPIAQWSGSG